MRAEPLYRITFSYRETFRAGDDVLLLAEGSVEGAVVTEAGATILLQLSGRGRPHADPVGRVTAAVTHTTNHERYAWLNDTVGAVAGEVYPGERVVLDVAALHWEPLPEAPGYDHGET